MKQEIYSFKNLEELSREAAGLFSEQAKNCIEEQGFFTAALCGGRTPKLLYEMLAQMPAMPWYKIHLFIGDERFIPIDNPESNFHMINELLISRIALPADNIHRVPIEIGLVDKTAMSYERDMRKFFILANARKSCHPEGASSRDEDQESKRDPSLSLKMEGQYFPVFDFMLLGLGEDGHTASLFPGDPAVDEKIRWTVPSIAPGSMAVRQRITLTLPVINNARCVAFLGFGESKKKVVELILNNREEARKIYPAALVEPVGRLVWLI
ncbi:6-phosphogluconolactonase [Elusimicrobiota bacterium]